MPNASMFRFTNLIAIGALGGAVASFDLHADPGELFQKRHAELVAKYDSDGNGWLNAEEREQMRAAVKPPTRQSRRGPRPPEEWLDKYDKDEDGELSRPEMMAAFQAERQIMTAKYDANSDNTLDSKEKTTIRKDLEAGKFEGMVGWVAHGLAQVEDERRRGRGSRVDPQKQLWLKHDADGDGKASAEEIAAIRAATKE